MGWVTWCERTHVQHCLVSGSSQGVGRVASCSTKLALLFKGIGGPLSGRLPNPLLCEVRILYSVWASGSLTLSDT